MTQPNTPRTEDSPLDDKLGGKVISLSPEQAVVRYPVAGNTQPYGLWHGGASAVAVETAGSLAAMAAVGPAGQAVGQELSVSHLRPARAGHVTATATALRVGGHSAVYDVSVRGDDGEEIAHGRITVALRRPKAI
ncbi:MAG: PaaI family thioesterase [Propionibacteriaceae bacterium]|nr:PaaI family thioesterase [Propionibacteriaceae bacterium]